ncbi:3'-5' exonuclease [Bradyrhizobium sp. HKCCYLS1011]|uniref:3'-5' exonuclease n=1 Tax=Bradyrhizobium sp. HKCCYLS1011 TaxID=3420733 RepID=UPI003EC04B77
MGYPTLGGRLPIRRDHSSGSPQDLVDAPIEDLERMVELLEATGRYRVLRRIEPTARPAVSGGALRRGVFVDVETTGLDVERDEIIELAMVPFEYDEGGEVCSIFPAFSGLRDPGLPIPASVTMLTGLSDESVAGHSIDPAEVSNFLSQAAVVIAHNAAFDRRFCERFCSTFAELPWACSLTEVPWRDEGFEGSRLAHLAAGHGLFFDGHRAVHDCVAGIEILSRRLPRCGRTALAVLLESARAPRWRVWATGAPYELRDGLKRRGYRWSDGSDGRPRAWYIDIVDEAHDPELQFLRREVYRRLDVEILSRRVTAYDRYSARY